MEIGPAEVDPAEVDPAKIDPVEIGPAEGGNQSATVEPARPLRLHSRQPQRVQRRPLGEIHVVIAPLGANEPRKEAHPRIAGVA